MLQPGVGNPGEPIEFGDADLRYHSGSWWLSVSTDMAPRREQGDRPRVVRFDLIDCFAHVDGFPIPSWAVGIPGLEADLNMDELKSKRDQHPRGSEAHIAVAEKITLLSAKQARQRREALHVWTTEIIRGSSMIRIVKPPSIKSATVSGRGDAKDWGAAVEVKATLNRSILSMAPAMTIQRLEYKAKEAGIPIEMLSAPEIASEGDAAIRVAKQVRRMNRAIKQEKGYVGA